MTTDDRFDVLDRRITAGLEDLAMPGSPEYLPVVLRLTARTAQRSPLLSGLRIQPMNRSSLAITAVAIAAVAVIGALLLVRPAVPAVGGPSPSATAAASASTAAPEGAALPAGLQGTWFGPSDLPVAGLAAGAGTALRVEATSLGLEQSNQQQRSLSAADAAIVGGMIQLASGARPTDGCQPGHVGTLTYTLSPSGQTLTIATDHDDCPAHAAYVASWWLADCNDGRNDCLGALDPGTYGSEYFASNGAHGSPWQPRYGALRFTVPTGWASFEDYPSAFGLAPAMDTAAAVPGEPPAAAIEIFSNAAGESQATPCSGQPDPAAAENGSAEFLRWLRSIGDLSVGNPTTLNVGGQSATVVDVSMRSSSTIRCGADQVVEYLISDGWFVAGTAGSTGVHTHGIIPGAKERLILLDNPSGYLIAIVLGANDASRFDDFVAAAMPIVQGLRFTDSFLSGQ
jgi:hypothetical protein